MRTYTDPYPLLSQTEPWGAAVATGVLSMLVGAAAITLPHVATLAVALMVGAVFWLGAILLAIDGATASRPIESVGALLLSTVSALIGTLVLFAPDDGAQALTLIVAAWFVASGMVRLVLAATGHLHAIFIAGSGAVALGLGALLLATWPESGAIALGLFLGVDFLLSGLVRIVTAAR